MSLFIFTNDLKNENSYGIGQIIHFLKKNIKITKKINVEIVNFRNLITKIHKIKKSKLVHIHGCWSLIHLLTFVISKIYKKKIYFSPHGMLMPHALKIKKLKKQIALKIYQKKILNHCDKIVVNSNLEKKFLKKLSNNKNISIIPHGIDINQKHFFKRNKNEKVKFFFYSRIHPIKGLFQLVNIWSKSKVLKKINLHIYGNVEDKIYFNKVKSMFTNNIRYLGDVNSANKYKLMKKYDVLIYPSYSENFGIIILEALNSGLYVLGRENLPWKSLNLKFAKLIKINKNSLEKNIISLTKKLAINKIHYDKKYLRNYLINNFSWKKISNIYLKIYNI